MPSLESCCKLMLLTFLLLQTPYHPDLHRHLKLDCAKSGPLKLHCVVRQRAESPAGDSCPWEKEQMARAEGHVYSRWS